MQFRVFLLSAVLAAFATGTLGAEPDATPDDRATVVPDPDAAFLARVRSTLSATDAGEPGENAAAIVCPVKGILNDPSRPPSTALAEIRKLVGAPEQPASADDANVVEFLRQMARSTEATAVPAPPTPRLLKRLSPALKSHPDPNVLEHSHMYFGMHGMLFEAQIAPHLFFYNNTNDLYGADVGQHRWAHAESFTPMIRLRNRNDTSGPIKTLSWMPKIDVQVMRLDRNRAARASMVTLHATLGHHSNGQDECSFQPGVLDREDLCPVPSQIEDVKINYPNGSFSTNYVRAGLVWKKMRLSQPMDVDTAIVTSALSFGGYGEVNPHGLKIGGTLPAVVRPLYGANRLRGIVQFEKLVGPVENVCGSLGCKLLQSSVRVNGWLDYIDKIPPGRPSSFTSKPDAPLNALYSVGDGSSRWRFGLEAAWTPEWLSGWGLEVRYDHGQDYYNMLYFQDIHWFQAGIVFDAAEFLPFKKKAKATRDGKPKDGGR
jgi:hypothetical protein